YTMPLWTVIFARVLVGERITPPRLAALGLGLAGMAALIAPDASALWRAPTGTLLMLIAAAAWAFGTALTKAQRWTIPTAVVTGWQIVLGAVPITLGAMLRFSGAAGADLASRLTSLSAAAVTGTAYATLVGVIFCHWAWFRLVAILPATVASIGTLGIPIVGLFTSAVIIGEPVGSARVVAVVLVVAGLGILFGRLSGREPESSRGLPAVSNCQEEVEVMSERESVQDRPGRRTLRLLSGVGLLAVLAACAPGPRSV